MTARLCLVSILFCSYAHANNFLSRDLIITSNAGDKVGICNLGATFLKPASSGAKALVLFVHGSGTSNRDEQIGNTHIFKDIAEKLASDGFASLRFDKRGIQPECRPPLVSNENLSPWNFVQDIRNIISYTENDPEMKDLPLVLLGHSEGVNFVTELASEGVPKLEGVVLLSGLGKYAIDETILRQYRQILDTPNLPPAEKSLIQQLIGDGTVFFGKIHDGTILPIDFYMSIYSKYWVDWIEITQNGAHSAHLVDVPSLVVRGTLDTNVTAGDFDALSAATQHISGSSDFAPVGLNHLLLSPGSTTVSNVALEAISTWLLGLK